MPTIEEMSLEEIEATIAQLRDRKKVLKKTGKAAERKINTLQNRRSRLMEQVQAIDAQIEALRHDANIEPAPMPKRRGRRPKSMSISA